jgi:glutathione S-transferase
MVELSKPFYAPHWYYELLYPAGPVLLRSLTGRLRRGRALDEMRREYERDLDLLESMAARRVDLCPERPTVFDFAVWGLLRTMEGLDGEELLGTRPHLLAWYAALKRL